MLNNTQELPSHVLCCDSLPIFEDLDSDGAAVCDTTIEREGASITDLAHNINLNGTPMKKNVNPFQYVNERTPIKRPLEAGQTNSNRDKKSKHSSPEKLCYKLGAIYQRIFKEKPETAHNAESDVKMLMLAAASYSSRFLDKLDESVEPFANVKKLW